MENFARVLERLAKAKAKNYNSEKIAAARQWLHGYMAKLGREPHLHPPDDAITAQFLAVAEWPCLEALLYELLAERKEPGHSYAWFVTVALQRIHGIPPGTQRQIRAQLRLVKPAPPRAPEPEQRSLLESPEEKPFPEVPAVPTAQELEEQIRRFAKGAGL